MSTKVTQTRPVSGFRRIRLEGSIDAVLEQGASESLLLEADAAVMDHIKAEVHGDELVIGLKNWLDYLLHPTRIYARIGLKEFAGLSASGSVKMTAAHLQGDAVALSVSGSADIRVDDLAARELQVRTSGSADYYLSGRVDRQELHTSGASRYEALGLESRTAVVGVSGSGHAAVSVLEQLDVSVSGAADVRYRGSPQVTQKVSGAASVHKVASS